MADNKAKVNTSVFRGSDAMIVLVDSENTIEEKKASEINKEFSLSNVIGRATNVEVKIETELQAFHELGERYPTDLRPGNVNISGTMSRAFINGALLKLLLGDAAKSRPSGSFLSPTFGLMFYMENPGLSVTSDISSSVTLHGVKLENWGVTIPEDDFIMETVSFKALWIEVSDLPSGGGE